MNSHDTKPTDKNQSNAILVQNELVLCGMEIKREPTTKQEPEDDELDDGDIVTVSRPNYTFNGVTLDNLIGGTSMNGNDDFVDFNNLVEIKPKVKTEKDSD